MTIRNYQTADNEQIIELLQLNTPKYFSVDEEKDLVDYLANHASNYYVVEIEGKLVGCGGFNLSNEGKLARISWDIIHPLSQGKGVGIALTIYRIEKIKEIKTVETLSVRTSQLVYKFYQKFGLKITENVKDHWGAGLDLYTLSCPINLINTKFK